MKKVQRPVYFSESKGLMSIQARTIWTVTVALLVALQIVLSRFLSINLQFLKIGFSFVPIMVAGYIYGAGGGVAVAAVSDVVGAVLFPSGPYFPGFTVTAALSGFIYGIAFGRKCTTPKIVAGVIIEQVVCGLLLNTWWLTYLYHSDFKVLILTRIWQIIVMIFVEIVFAEVVFRRLSFVSKLKSRVLKNERLLKEQIQKEKDNSEAQKLLNKQRQKEKDC